MKDQEIMEKKNRNTHFVVLIRWVDIRWCVCEVQNTDYYSMNSIVTCNTVFINNISNIGSTFRLICFQWPFESIQLQIYQFIYNKF